jgi:RNA polymerase sigma factor (sigma-70 family)
MKHVNDAKARLGDASASVERIAEEANLAENLVASAMKASRMSHSLDVNADDDGDGGRLKDVLTTSPEQHDPYTVDLEDVSLEESLELALSRLSDRERLVIQRRFGIGQARAHTLAEVAKELGVSLERVRQIQVRAIHKLDNPELRKAVDPFLN